MTVKQLLAKYYEGLDADAKPTTDILPQTIYRAIDTQRIWICYDGTNWVIADKRVRLVNEDGEFIDAEEAKSNYGSSTGAVLTVDLDTGAHGGRLYVEIWVKSSAAATFTVYGSRNNTDWRATDTIVLAAAGEFSRGYDNAYRYIRVATTDINDSEAEIVASR